MNDGDDGVLDKFILVSDHTPRLPDIILGAVKNIVCGVHGEADDHGLLYIDSGDALSYSKRCDNG